ncbi:hypothetical protein HCZ13_01670 [Limosilactobacillus fermentum]|uniref:Uncharacterized protein n=1 Tax=Limosilactobacillus fermentum TaxID=1613 RepID=A0A1L7GX43_LIMFE|nr:hypothetical protein [Limosilactobacillus fermentum]APU46666.1 hypothetical protein BUW47_09735 [Limosilactobacillus fermentum]
MNHCCALCHHRCPHSKFRFGFLIKLGYLCDYCAQQAFAASEKDIRSWMKEHTLEEFLILHQVNGDGVPVYYHPVYAH